VTPLSVGIRIAHPLRIGGADAATVPAGRRACVRILADEMHDPRKHRLVADLEAVFAYEKR
jgi:hypothetical protein